MTREELAAAAEDEAAASPAWLQKFGRLLARPAPPADVFEAAEALHGGPSSDDPLTEDPSRSVGREERLRLALARNRELGRALARGDAFSPPAKAAARRARDARALAAAATPEERRRVQARMRAEGALGASLEAALPASEAPEARHPRVTPALRDLPAAAVAADARRRRAEADRQRREAEEAAAAAEAAAATPQRGG
jgi:hypothetical protein